MFALAHPHGRRRIRRHGRRFGVVRDRVLTVRKIYPEVRICHQVPQSRGRLLLLRESCLFHHYCLSHLLRLRRAERRVGLRVYFPVLEVVLYIRGCYVYVALLRIRLLEQVRDCRHPGEN